MADDPYELLTLCNLCLNLCRDVCPVAVHAGRDDLVPNEKTRAAAAALGLREGPLSTELLDACTDCGACTEYCLLDVPVFDWLDRARAFRPDLPPRPAPARRPAAPAATAAELSADALALTCCTGSPDPADQVMGIRRLAVPLGSSCCGARLPEGVGGPELADRMARGMLALAPDGAVVAVTDAGCAAQLAHAAGGRVQVVCLGSAGAPPPDAALEPG